jgi:hypothetical protein
MTKKTRPDAVALALALALGGSSAWAASRRVVGQVTGPDGLPVRGAEVTAGGAAAHTDAGGFYLLEGVETGRRAVVRFAKPGYATTYGIVEMPALEDSDDDGVPDNQDRCPLSDRRPTVVIDGCDTGLGSRLLHGCTAMDVILDCSACAHKPWHLLGCLAEPRFRRRIAGLDWMSLKQSIACVRRATPPLLEAEEAQAASAAPITLHKALPLAPGPGRLDAAEGGTVERDGFKVTFLPGSIDAHGLVDVVLTPLDVAGRTLETAPGDFRGTGGDHEEALIETDGMVEVAVTKKGRPVRLRVRATIEAPLPTGSPLAPGDRIEVWSFERRSGLWKKRLHGATVGDSTVSPGRLAAFAKTRADGWWNAAHEVEAGCLCASVEDGDGSPVAGALVTAAGLERHGVWSAASGSDGSYCVEIPRATRVSLRASVVADGRRQDSGSVELESSLAPGHCPRDGCGDGPTLVIADADKTCVSGHAVLAAGFGATVEAFDAETGTSYGRVDADPSGNYTISGLPVSRLIDIELQAPDCNPRVRIETGPAGGGACTPVPDLGCGF